MMKIAEKIWFICVLNKMLVRQCKSDYDKQFTYQLKNSMASNSKEFWKLLRPQKQNNNSVISPNNFFEYFKKLYIPSNVDYIVDDDIYEYMRQYNNGILQTQYNELNNPISDAEVQKAIKELKAGKACGGDMLINELYVCGIVSLLPKLTALFNLIFFSAHFPSTWKNGVIIPIYKNGDMSDVNNFRGITLLSTLGKPFTKVLNNRLTFWSDTYDILSDTQAGFRKGRGTIDNIFIIQFIRTGEKVYCAFIDFRKAFDYLNRDCLWFKLLKSGIRGNMYDIIKHMYEETTASVKHQGILSDIFECNLGVRQGESISLFLFNLFLNDLDKALCVGQFQGINIGDINIKTLLYADDLALLLETREDLQVGLDI